MGLEKNFLFIEYKKLDLAKESAFGVVLCNSRGSCSDKPNVNLQYREAYPNPDNK